MKEFNSHNELLEGFVVSVYVLGFAFGPLVIAPLSEMWGRLKLYHSCSFLFLVCTIICAVSTSMNMLIVFRFLAGSVGAAPLALGGGTIADLIPREQRATAMAIWVLGPSMPDWKRMICEESMLTIKPQPSVLSWVRWPEGSFLSTSDGDGTFGSCQLP